MTEDILERAKDAAENIDHYAYDCDFEEARLVILALIPEVERLRSDWRQEHATAETWKEDFKKMQKRLTDSELLRQAQYNQTAAKDARIKELGSEVERLRSENKIISDRAAHHEKQDAAEIELLAARIKELEAVISEAFQELVTAGPDIGDIAAMSISLAVRKLASQNKRLEAAFLKAKSRLIQVTENKSNPCGLPLRYTASERNAMAREVLERIKEGRKDD